MADGRALLRSTAPDHFSSAEPYGAPRSLSHSPWLTGQKIFFSKRDLTSSLFALVALSYVLSPLYRRRNMLP